MRHAATATLRHPAWLILAAAAACALLLASCGPTGSDGCQGPSDCSNDRFCVEGVCQATPGYNFVSGEEYYKCMIRHDSKLECRPRREDSPNLDIPDVTVDEVHIVGKRVCGLLKTDSTIACWDIPRERERVAVPDGRFQSFQIAGIESICGLRTDGRVTCSVSDEDYLPASLPGQYIDFSADMLAICAIREDRTLYCEGRGQFRNIDDLVPDGQFQQIAVGGFHACGLKTDGSVECFGSGTEGEDNRYAYGQANPPGGRFVQLEAGPMYTCGVRPDRTLECWGDVGEPPSGRFKFFSINRYQQCGILEEGEPFCWPDLTDSGSADDLLSQ